MLTKKDVKFLEDKSIDVHRIEKQIKQIQKGKQYIKAERAATVGDGILKFGNQEIDEFTEVFNKFAKDLQVVKFVPASGAATRMFKRLIALKEQFKGTSEEFLQIQENKDFYGLKNTFDNLDKFAFYPDLFGRFLHKKQSLEKYIKKNEYAKIASLILGKSGLNYAQMPKALVAFHKYAGYSRTAFDEHLVDATLLCKGFEEANVHFTIQPEHEKLFEKQFKYAVNTFLDKDIDYNLSFSEQSEASSCISLNSDGKLLRDKKQYLLLRPGGHGALIENLNGLDADLVFINNIDNVAPDTIKENIIKYKKFIGGYLIGIREKVFDVLNHLDKKVLPSDEKWTEILDFVKTLLPNISLAEDRKQAVVELKYLLNRPIRVCGMVENTSEPGGGPFWVKTSEGNEWLQILEKAQIKLEDENQREIFEQSTHFNPVDIVCSVRDYKGGKFNLLNYVDENAGLVVEKTHNGETIHSYELPGLWNGAMSQWLSIFIEVPKFTFTPVKELNDLLRIEHQTAK